MTIYAQRYAGQWNREKRGRDWKWLSGWEEHSSCSG